MSQLAAIRRRILLLPLTLAASLPSARADDALEEAISSRQVGETRLESGKLSSNDETLDTGEFSDEHAFSAEKGDILVIDLYATDLDPYLIVREESDTSEFQLDNDDFGTDTSRSQIVFMAPRTTTYLAVATSFEPGETGPYRLTIRQVAPDPESGGERRKESGSLAPGDDQLEMGEFVDTHILAAEAGDLVTIDMTSEEFDTYLFVTGPDGSDFEVHNDDYGGSMSQSRILLLAPVDGTYQIHATSYEGGETGTYRLTIREL